MKLHLPLSLRSALLALCALASFSTVGARDTYWVDSDGLRYDMDEAIYEPLNLENAEAFILKDGVKEDDGYTEPYGGAIVWGYRPENPGYGDDFFSTHNVINAKRVEISNNRVYGREMWLGLGGAIYLHDNISLTFNACGEVSITGNGAHALHEPDDMGCLLDAGPGGDVFRHAKGGAIVYYGGTVLAFTGNDHVNIRGNYASTNEACILNAISTIGTDVAFAAKSNQVVECYDGLDVDGMLWINTTHQDLRVYGESYAGTVILSGEHAAEDLRQIKGEAATENELVWSQWVRTSAVHVEEGTLVLKDTKLQASHDFSFSDTPAGPYLFYSSAQAEVQLHNATITTGWYDSGWSWEYGSDDNLKLHDGSLEQYGSVALPNASFTGHNVIQANYINAENGVWTFHVSAANAEQALLSIVFDGVSRYEGWMTDCYERGLQTYGTTFRVLAEDGLENGKYKLLEFEWIEPWYYDSIMLDGEVEGIWNDRDRYVYFTCGEDNVLTLWYRHSMNADEAPITRPAATLTWASDSGIWAEGENSGEWSSDAEDSRFHVGDSVVFDREAEVWIYGEVLPGNVLVSNEEGVVSLINGDDEATITGSTGVTKTGEGTLSISTGNAYTGDTVIQGGVVEVYHDLALGLGTVQLQGGTLSMNGCTVATNIRVTGKATLLGSRSYAGRLTLEGGALSGDTIYLSQDAELISGSISNDIDGYYGMLKSGKGTVTLSGSISNTRGTEVQEGTLALRGSSLRYTRLTVNADATLIASGVSLYYSDLTLHDGAVVRVENELTLDEKSTLTTHGAQTITGNLALEGATLQLGDTLTVEGVVSVAGEITIDMDVDKLFADEKICLLTAQKITGVSTDTLHLPELASTRATAQLDGSSITITLNKQQLTWEPGKAGTWGMLEEGDEWNAAAGVDRHFYKLDAVVFDCDAGQKNEVQLVGELHPGAISVKGAGDTVFTGEGSLIGSATLTKEGAGTLRLETDNSGYSGDIIVKGGTLEVAHSDALGNGSAVLVQNGATFDGGDLPIYNRAISLSGATTLKNASNVSNLHFESGARVSSDRFTLRHSLSIGKEGAEFIGRFHFSMWSSLTLNGGVFTITGTVTHDEPYEYYPEYYSARSYYDEWYTPAVTTIDVSGWDELYCGGDFTLMKLTLEDGVDINKLFQVDLGYNEESQNLFTELEYVNGTLVLHVISAGLAEETLSTLSANQSAVYNALETAREEKQISGELARMYRMLNSIVDDADAARAMLDRLSGEELATAMTSQLEGNMAHLRRLRANMGSGQRLDGEGKNSAYILGYDSQNHVDANGDAPGMKRTEWGGTVGLERCVREQSLIGVALTSGSATVNPTRGESYDEDALRVDFYAVGNFGKGWQAIMSVGFGKHDFSITRQLPGGITASSSPVGYSLNFQEEVSYTKQLNEKSWIQPFASIEVSANVIPSFSENGAGTAALESHDCSTSAVDLTLGARYIRSFAAAAGRTGQLSLQAAIIMSESEGTTDMSLHFAGAPSSRFTVSAANTDAMGFNLGASLLYPVTKHAAVTASANAILRSGSEETGASVGLKITF